ncbi:peptidyl-prolyl cis-trans isomerase [Paenibacillus caui]|uniref:peptidyl-prolyl cis-trans isomerase n=1 Tax=Paenibacillus caui TaxID=2873927 RepID=UPI001CA7DA9D|nr:peptidyl-prolyl cis-trans isomerase [Paenibacillus caui]
MAEEKKDLQGQGMDPKAPEPVEEEQAQAVEGEHKAGEAADEPVAGQAEALAVTGTGGGNEALAAVSGEEPAGEAQETAVKRGGNQVWIGISLLLAVLLVISLFKSPFAQKDSEKAVATVNNVKITKGQLYDALVKAGGEQTLSGMIDDELIRQEAENAKVQVTDADVKKERDFYIKQFGSEDSLNQLLAQNGMTEEDFQKQLKREVQIRKLLGPKVTITDEQIKQYFEQNKAKFDTPAQVRASQIVVATEAEAKTIVKQLQGGADFAALAKEKSTDTATKENGGDLGFFSKGSGALDTAVEDEAFKLKKDEISTPIKTGAGTYAVIKVTDTKAAHTATLEEKKEEIKDVLITQQVSSMSQSWLEDLRSKAKITNTIEKKATDKEGAAETTPNE